MARNAGSGARETSASTRRYVRTRQRLRHAWGAGRFGELVIWTDRHAPASTCVACLLTDPNEWETDVARGRTLAWSPRRKLTGSEVRDRDVAGPLASCGCGARVSGALVGVVPSGVSAVPVRGRCRPAALVSNREKKPEDVAVGSFPIGVAVTPYRR